MSLRIYHLEEQLERDRRRPGAHRPRRSSGSSAAASQQADLSQSLAELLADLAAGRKMLQGLPPDEDVQRPDAQSVPVPAAARSRVALNPRCHRLRGATISSNAIATIATAIICPWLRHVHRSLTHARHAVATRRLDDHGVTPAPRRVLQVITPSHMSGAETQLVRLTRRMRDARPRDAGAREARLARRGRNAATAASTSKRPASAARSTSLAIPAIARAAHAAPRRARPVEPLDRQLVVRLARSRSAGPSRSATCTASPPPVGIAGRATCSPSRAPCATTSSPRASRATGSPCCTTPSTPTSSAPRATRSPSAPNSAPTPTTPVIGTFGHLSVKKGYRELFAAMPRMLAQLPQRPVLDHRPGRPAGRARSRRPAPAASSTTCASPASAATPPTS